MREMPIFFVGSQVSSTKKGLEENKFGELFTKEIHRGYYTVARRYEFYVR